MKLVPVIMSGGSGTRLWPLSREQYPKQLLALTGEHTLLQDTVRRLAGLGAGSADLDVLAPLIICNEQHRFLVAEQLRAAGLPSSGIILEPVGRNTAPALTLAALQVEKTAPDAVMLVMPSDHVIADTAAFHVAVRRGAALAQGQALVTFGIVPTGPETGYGYIRKGAGRPDGHAFQLAAFVEKPNQETAARYLASGDYLWNSGMFVLKASTWLAQIQTHRPDILAACQAAFEQGTQDMDFFRVDAARFAACPSDSIDYAVMEKAAGEAGAAVVIPLDAGWSDIGAWSALWEVAVQDADGNVLRGDVVVHGVTDSLVHADHRLVAAIGLEHVLIVETADAVLVAHKDSAQDVKRIVDWLKAQGRTEQIVHRRVFRPWGNYEGVVAGERFQVKRIVVNPGASLSLQMHHHRAEHWVVVKGTARVTKGDESFLISENQSTYIPLGVKHRLENPGTLPLEIIEVQSGSYLGEDDIVRFDDRYGRSP